MILNLNGQTLYVNAYSNQAIQQICLDQKQVLDEDRGFLVFLNSDWHFVGLEQAKLFINQETVIKKIAVILESPHKDEYDADFVPIRPANGRTGRNLEKKLSLQNKILPHLEVSNMYLVRLMNPVQYQASCAYFVKRSIRSETDKVFRTLFSKKGFNLRDDFIERLQAFQPDIILNCCTYALGEGVVSTAINESHLNTFVLRLKHPSCW